MAEAPLKEESPETAAIEPAGGVGRAVTRKKKKSMTLSQKVELINAFENGHQSRSLIAKEFGVSKSTVSDIIKKKDRIVEAYEECNFGTERKRLRTSFYVDVEQSLLSWLKNARALGIPITGPAVQSKGRELAVLMGHPDFVCSQGWLHRFKARHGIMFRPLHECNGEPASNSRDDWLSGGLPRLLMDYSPQNIFSAGEMGFYWKALPDSVGKIIAGDGIENMERFTILICTNMTGEEKLPLLVIGSCSNPVSFTNICTLPVLYEANDEALMKKEIFNSWLLLIDRKFQQEKRKIAMVIDNASCHRHVQSQLEAVKLIFLPHKESHPCNGGVTRNLKINYRKYLLIKLHTIIEAKEEFSMDLIDALHLLHLSWVNVSKTAIKSSFSLSGFKDSDSDKSPDTSKTPPPEVVVGDTLIGQLRGNGLSILESLTFEQYVNVDKDTVTSFEANTVKGPLNLHTKAEQVLPTAPPSARETDKAVVVLRRYFEARHGMEHALNLVAELEKRVLDCYAAQLP
jgi:predicted DNA-binding protein YlxM (UPF0122 family)